MGWDFGYFLMTDDPDDHSTHTVKITNTSHEAQDVYVGAHVWDSRGYSWYNDDCNSVTGWSNQHYLKGNGQQLAINSNYPDKWLEKKMLQVGESIEVEVEFNWVTGATRDWSVTAWGTEGTI